MGKSIIIDKIVQENFAKYCKENGYVMGHIVEYLINDWLRERLEEDEKKE